MTICSILYEPSHCKEDAARSHAVDEMFADILGPIDEEPVLVGLESFGAFARNITAHVCNYLTVSK